VIRRGVGLAVKLGLLVVVLLAGYIGVTFVQVWGAARSDDTRPADAIVVMGAAQYSGRPSPVFRARLDHAADLYDQGIASTVMLTGGGAEGDRTEASVGEGYLLGRGIPESAMLLETQGTTSWQSLAASARILRREGLTDVVVVTDPSHAYRSVAIAEEVGLEAYASPRPGASRLNTLLRETAAVAVGRVVGFGRLERIDRVREASRSR
jgi:uncharacterized SAM-binding protein YcdF (DUF218 family)